MVTCNENKNIECCQCNVGTYQRFFIKI